MSRALKIFLTICVFPLAAWAFSSSAAAAEQASSGEDTDTFVKRVCGDCHTIESVTLIRKVRSDWAYTVRLMRTYGLVVSDEQTEQIIEYLAAHHGL